MNNRRRSLIILCVGVGLTLMLAGLVPLAATAQESTPVPEATEASVYDPSTPPITPTGNNSYCAVCHSQPLRAVALPDGFTLRLYVTPQMIADSVHGGETPLGCVDCHGIDAFPHSGPTPSSHRQYTLDSVKMCVGCHVTEATDLQNGLHEQAILAGNTAAAVCTDCHGAHDVLPVNEQPEITAGICGTCHTDTLVQWQGSPHVNIGPLGCASCHSPHTQMIRAGDTPNGLCLNCHEEELVQIDLWVHTSHINPDSEVGCVDCHMHFDGTTPDAQTVSLNPLNGGGHTMSVVTVACTTCHENYVSVEVTPEAPQPPTTAVINEEGDAEPARGGTGEFVELLQGLILGLGFGATGAAIFVSRGNPRRGQ